MFKTVLAVGLLFFALIVSGSAQTGNSITASFGFTSTPTSADAYEKLLNADPNDAIAANNLGTMYFRSGRVDEAVSLLKRAADARPDVENFQRNLSIALTSRGDLEGALVYARRAAEAVGADSRSKEQLCSTYLALKRGSEAVDCFGSLLKTSDADDLERAGYAEALIVNGQPDMAELVLRAVVTSSPRFASAHNLLGVALYELKHTKEAVRSLREAVELDPDQPRFRLNLGVAFLKVGNKEGALSQYRFLRGSSPELADELYRLIFADKILYVGPQH